MDKFPIALQLYSVRDDMENDFLGTLKKVKKMGYDGVEFAGLYGHTAEEVKKMVEDADLTPISAHVPFADMKNNPELLEEYAFIGCKYVVIPHLGDEYRPGREKYDEFKEDVKKLGKKARSLGMSLGYHNHDFEFEKLGGEYILDIMYKDSAPEDLMTQLDTCWVNVGGVDPADYIRKYNGRVEIIHLKDFVGQKSENMYGLIGVDDGKGKGKSEEFELRPVGYGVQNFPEILKAAEDVGAKWVVVEQDSPSMGKTPLECAEMSINYLKSL